MNDNEKTIKTLMTVYAGLSFVWRQSMNVTKHVPIKEAKIFALKKAVELQDADAVDQILTHNLMSHLSEQQRTDILDDAGFHLNFKNAQGTDPVKTKNGLMILEHLINSNIITTQKDFMQVASIINNYSTNKHQDIIHLCGHPSINDQHKSDFFVWLFSNHRTSISIMNNIFDMWKPHLKGEGRLTDHLHLTLLGRCCEFATDHVLRCITQNMTHISQSQCYKLLERQYPLSHETLQIFIDKGVDIEDMIVQEFFPRFAKPNRADILNKVSESQPNIFEAVQAHYKKLDAEQIRDEILEHITIPQQQSHKRKM